MPRRVAEGGWTYLTLMFASALAVHAVFDVVDTGPGSLLRPIHAVYVSLVVAALILVHRHARSLNSAERRRRGALLKAEVLRSPQPLFVSLLAQLGLAAFTLALESSAADASRLAVAAVCALVALLCGAIMLASVERTLCASIFAAIAERCLTPRAPVPPDRRLSFQSAAQRPYHLFLPNRPPPVSFA